MSFAFDSTLEQGLLAAGLGILLADHHGHLVRYNRAAEKLFHLSEQDIDRPLPNIQGTALALAFSQSLKTQQAINSSIKIPGNTNTLQFCLTPFFPLDSNLPMLLVTVHSTSEPQAEVSQIEPAPTQATNPAILAFECLPEAQPMELLVVDDDEDSRYLMLNNLHACKTGHFSITEADSSAQAIEKLKQQRFDVCITDYRLIDDTALELFKQARALELNTPFIVVTNYSEESLYSQLQGTGIADLISKSDVTPELLQRSIRYAVQKHQLAQSLRNAAH